MLPFVSSPQISTMVQIAMTIQQKEKNIQELKNLKEVIRIENQLILPQIQQKFSHLREQFETQVCSENPTAFWKKAKYFI